MKSWILCAPNGVTLQTFVRVLERSPPSRLIHCKVCKESLTSTDGEYALKYFLIEKGKNARRGLTFAEGKGRPVLRDGGYDWTITPFAGAAYDLDRHNSPARLGHIEPIDTATLRSP